MFVLASGTVDEYRAEPGPVDYVLPLDPGMEADWLLAETSRRLQVLASLPARPDRDRIVAVSGAETSGARLGRGQGELLALADGRRTPRDLAFALGRGVYATLLQLARMQEVGLLVTASYRDLHPEVRVALGSKSASADALPRRSKNAGDVSRRAVPWSRSRDLAAPLGLLRPRSRREGA
jgi:hypothetical protein